MLDFSGRWIAIDRKSWPYVSHERQGPRGRTTRSHSRFVADRGWDFSNVALAARRAKQQRGAAVQPLRRECRFVRLHLTACVHFYLFAHKAAGAASARHYLRPRLSREGQTNERLGHFMSRERPSLRLITSGFRVRVSAFAVEASADKSRSDQALNPLAARQIFTQSCPRSRNKPCPEPYLAVPSGAKAIVKPPPQALD